MSEAAAIDPVVCGSLRVTRWFEGMEQEVRWCHRTSGPCPFSGTGISTRTRSLCEVVVEEAPDRPARFDESLCGTVVAVGGGLLSLEVDCSSAEYPENGQYVEVSW